MKFARPGDRIEVCGEYTDIVVSAGEPRSVWHSTAGGVATLRQHKSEISGIVSQTVRSGAYKKLFATP